MNSSAAGEAVNVRTLKTAVSMFARRRAAAASSGKAVSGGGSWTDDSVRSDSTDDQQELQRRSGGCLKHLTQEQSLRHRYGTTRTSSSTSDDGAQQEEPPRRTVSFDTVTFSSHAVCLGDNPSVSSGPPIAIEWKSFETSEYDVDNYESTKLLPREKAQMLVPKSLREEWLRSNGHTRSEIAQTVKEVQKVKARRRQSSNDGAMKDKLCRMLKLNVANATGSSRR